ncbi:MAG: glycosyl-4,4'-diaponeurosporenoate acyltransferase [Acidimicrobiales bacterium]|nr:MAG: glycosyl-4,4'-diaponeurosporenoate acyltransferase [Acidimicrobiales bacterium]
MSLRMWHPEPAVALAVDITVLAVGGTVVGYLASRIPRSRLRGDSPLFEIRSFEHRGRVYERLAIRRWKDRLPEAGGLFRGGMSKRRLPGRGPEALSTFRAETVRAELVHWILVLGSPVFALWNPPYLTLAMIGYSLVANVPCLLVQRFNRARIDAILRRVCT